MYTVHVSLKNRPQDSNVSVPGLGLFKNGQSAEVSEAKVNRALANNPRLQSIIDGTNINIGGAETASTTDTASTTEQDTASPQLDLTVDDTQETEND